MNKEGMPKRRKIIERNQMENLELDSTAAEVRTSLERFRNGSDCAEKTPAALTIRALT